jgi:hypothetical protein
MEDEKWSTNYYRQERHYWSPAGDPPQFRRRKKTDEQKLREKQEAEDTVRRMKERMHY